MLHSVVLISVLELQLRKFDIVTLLLHVIDVISCAIQMDIIQMDIINSLVSPAFCQSSVELLRIIVILQLYYHYSFS